ncbi:MAG: FMN-binding protein, partial [Erysipelotrichales bacterium]|nr:FMN-binding protein [Erysipelotrichales bacterium]
MNKFLKYPLFLGIVGAICSFMLAAVYGFTSPIINERINNETNAAITELYPSATSVKNVSSDYSNLKESGISIIYEIKSGNSIAAYGYQASTTGYGGAITNLIIVSATENKIEAFKNISHTETKGGKYGDVLLSSSDFAAQFVGLEFEKITTDIDFAGGSTAAITLNAVKQCVQNVINYHLTNVKGEEIIEVTEQDFAHLGFDGASFVSKFDEYKTKAGSRVDKVLSNTGITNYYEAVDANNNVVGYAYYLNYEYEAYENGI